MKLTALAIVLATALGVAAQVKKPEPPSVKKPFAESLQALVVTTKDWNATTGVARTFERKTPSSKWTAVGDEFPIVVGRSGLAWAQDSAPDKASQFKKEGDGKSPAGVFPLTFAFGSSTKPELLTVPYTKIEQFTECVDDTSSTHYNTVVGRMQVGNFDWKSSEKMSEIKPEYDLGVFVAYNSYPIVKGNGSCIFLHIWEKPDSTTSGCTAMERRNLERVVGWLDEKKNPYLIQLTEDQYGSMKKRWNLPNLK